MQSKQQLGEARLLLPEIELLPSAEWQNVLPFVTFAQVATRNELVSRRKDSQYQPDPSGLVTA